MSRQPTENFRFWDGEGADIDGVHRYILMMCYDGEHAQHVQDTRGISTQSAFEFLFKYGQGAGVANIIFSGGYDINMILRDVPLPHLQELSNTNEVEWEGWQIKYVPKKFFVLRKSRHSVSLYDCFGFFTTSLVNAINGIMPDYPADEMEKIMAGKAQRGSFQPSDLPWMRQYCLAELTAGREMMLILLDALNKLGLPITSWHGASAIADKMLSKNQISRHMDDHSLLHGPEYRKAIRTAFAGGRIELIKPGDHAGPIYHYDINSAYPASMSQLRSLLYRCAFVFCEKTNCKIYDHDLCHVQADFISEDVNEVYPLFKRTRHNGIVFPSQVDGWYWGPEVIMCQEFFPKSINILEHYHFRSMNTVMPFRWIEQVYNDRQRYKAEGSHLQIVLKLGLNSMYGKTAQRLGWREQKAVGTQTYEELVQSKALPRWHQLEWAGLITSMTRAKLYRAAMTNINEVIAFETDGIYANQPLKVVESPKLGDWDSQTHDRLTYVQSGFYYLQDGDETKEKYRGLPKGSISREMVLASWETEYPYVTVDKVTRFPSLRESVQSESRMKHWRTWAEFPKEVQVKAPLTKRKVVDPESIKNGSYARTVPVEDVDIVSYPRALPWDKYGCPPDLVDDDDAETYFVTEREYSTTDEQLMFEL